MFELGLVLLFAGSAGTGGGRGERPARPRAAASKKKGRIVGGVGCPPNYRTSGKLRGSSGEAPTL